MSTVLFVCLHNAGRSQISRALFDRVAAGAHTAQCGGATHEPCSVHTVITPDTE